ncbi:phosphonate metabolism protein/1,5-bisphosphokinase (PRPP-forming) PhnN [Pseudomonas sp. DC3000-4b1]|uniref:phosphonate metabolism protein/1,5-bisphosphokinase (PRPP-forming) PhnN n=1 Tax=unclassified Pseudomonas TaxID=196821 RepID=UPI003CF8B1A8
MQQGRLIYLMGASGVGKDSVIDAARSGLAERGIEVARRVITRSAEALGEQALGVSHETFEAMLRERRFALSWRANDLCYGIPVEIEQSLQAGRWVLVNGSRGYLPQALVKYPSLLAVLITVENQVLRERLETRGRETPAQIDARLARNAQLHQSIGWRGDASGILLLDNSGFLADAAQALLGLIDERLNAVAD